MNEIIKYFTKPQIMAVVSDVNQGKSNLIYYLIQELTNKFNFNLYTYGLKYVLPSAKKIHSLAELENIKNSVIFLDEFQSLFDLEDRKKKQQIENTLRLINHNNNILVLIGLAENFKKFISSRLSVIFYKKTTFENFINGSSIKKNILNYCGDERGSAILNLDPNEVIVFDGDYTKYIIPYLSEFDSKKQNVDILVQKTFNEKYSKNVPEKIVLLKQFIKNSQTLQEAKKQWNKETGLSERAFQRYNKQLKETTIQNK